MLDDRAIIPKTQKEHKFCGSMTCAICTQRCYEADYGHIFHNGQDKPCDCGEFANMKECQDKHPPAVDTRTVSR
jgi:hypothetical protein